jgi:dsDNA-binding SOS-regulon protein
MADANKKRLIVKPDNAVEMKLIDMFNKHSDEFFTTIEKYSEENIDKIIEGADNLIEIQKFAVNNLEIKEHKLLSHTKIRNKEAIVKQDRDKQVDPINRGAYALLEEDEI